MLEPRRTTGAPPVRSRASAAISATSSTARPSSAPALSPCPRMSNASAARPSARHAEAGRLEVGGCDLVELAQQFGTPAYVVEERDLRARARAFVEAFAQRT